MRNRDTVLRKDMVKRKSFLKNEFKKIIFKSISQNFGVTYMLRIEVLKNLIFFKRKSSISRQNNVCLLTGRVGGVYGKYNLSRHSIKRVGKLNMLNNTKAASF